MDAAAQLLHYSAGNGTAGRRVTSVAAGGISHYFLYGEQAADVELDFLHIEPIRERSGPNDWRIRPHVHPDHLQILLVREGGGSIRIEDAERAIAPPAVLLVPAGTVHQITFAPGTDGHVITAALGCLRAAAALDPGLAAVARRPAVHTLAADGPALPLVGEIFADLHREFTLGALPGRRAAILAQFARALVAVLRLSVTRDDPRHAAPDRDHDLVLRYRGLLETHFRDRRALGFYAGELAVTPARLNAACKARAGRTASDLLYERIVIEAKRYLVYTESSVAQVAHLTGFEDPAYFNRFFARRVGLSPGAYRRQAPRAEVPQGR